MSSPSINSEPLQKILHLDRGKLDQLAGCDWILAYSGGADSALLLRFLLEFQKNAPQERKLWLYHLNHEENHGLKSISKRKKIMAEHLQEAQSVPLLDVQLLRFSRPVFKIAEKQGGSFEHTGSRLRKKHLLQLARKLPGSLIFTGHTLSDWYETLIMRINRGASPSALYPFDFSTKEFSTCWVRPLYKSTRNEVRALCQKLQLPYWDDPANSDGTNRRSLVRDRYPVFHPNGLRKSASLFLEQQAKENEFCEKTLQKIKDSLKVTAGQKEYRLKAAAMHQLSRPEREFITTYLLQNLGLWPLSSGIRKELEYLPFHHKVYHIELENWSDELYIVFRRGRGTLPLPTNHLTEITGTNMIRGDQITKSHFISLTYGKKSVKKIFSEKRLSLRQRRHLFLPLKSRGSHEVTEVDLSIFGLKKIDQASV